MRDRNLCVKLNALTVFRNLLDRPIISAFSELLRAYEIDDNENLYVAYSKFVAMLFKECDCITDYILNCVLEDDNFYIKSKGSGKTLSKTFDEAVKIDLQFLAEVSAVKASDITGEFAIKLPLFKSYEADFVKIYEEKLLKVAVEGYGVFTKYKAFMFDSNGLEAIKNPDAQSLASLKGYEYARDKVVKNTESFLKGKSANNAFLYGDAGTGKSSTVKAVLNEFSHMGLRLIEIKKSSIVHLPKLLDELAENPLKFILFIDDLSFAPEDKNFSTLKAILEGSVVVPSKNCIIYATSNRRHLVKELMSEREGDDIHLRDTLQETLSLSARFGLTVTFNAPNKDDYLQIVDFYADKFEIDIEREKLHKMAMTFEVRNGGRSPRTAKHFISSLMADTL